MPEPDVTPHASMRFDALPEESARSWLAAHLEAHMDIDALLAMAAG